MDRLMKDLEIDRARNPQGALADRWDPDNEDEDEDDGDINIVDRSKFSSIMPHTPGGMLPSKAVCGP